MSDLPRPPGYVRDHIRCPQCGLVSWNPQDVHYQYCGNCHQYHIDMEKRDSNDEDSPPCPPYPTME